MKLHCLLAVSVLWAGSATAASTGSTGGNAPFSQYQPSLVLNQLFATGGIFPSNGGGDSSETLGMVRSFAGNYTAFGAPYAQGQLLGTQQNTPIFSILGTNFGGDGKVNFALPDLAGRTIIGNGAGPGGTTYSIGQQTGSATTVLTEANLPAHDHSLPGGGVTGMTGNGTAFDNHEPSLTLTSMIAVTGFFPSPAGNLGGNHVTVGEISEFAGNFVPSGWVAADGSILSIADNQALFDVIGKAYGGDGTTTFALPDLRGRTVVGVGQGIGLAAVTLGEQFGTASTTLTIAGMPAHDHVVPGGVTGLTGDGAPFDTHQPSLGMTYIISVAGIFPSNGGGGSISDQSPYVGEVMAYAGTTAPGGWTLADGRLLSIADNQALFDIVGTIYGGDGTSTFALPDLRGRSILGSGRGFALGVPIGSDTTTLNVANLAAHEHSIDVAVAGVPEPASWALMLTGFGITGIAARRRRPRNIVVS